MFYFSFGILGLLVKVKVAHGLLANHSLMLMLSGDVFMFEAGNETRKVIVGCLIAEPSNTPICYATAYLPLIYHDHSNMNTQQDHIFL